MAKLAVVFLALVAVCASARELKQQAKTLSDLPKQLQELNARMASMPASTSSGHGYERDTDMLRSYYRDEAKYHGDKYEHKYEHEPKYEKREHRYDHPRAEHEEGYDRYDNGEGYGYGPKKVVVELREAHRTSLRAQDGNNQTFLFTSELTCANPKDLDREYAEDGTITLPIAADHTKIVTVAVCEWTVNKVQEQEVTEKATLKGSNQVVCTFNDEAASHCHDGEILTKGLTLSGQGLVYGFEEEKTGKETEVFLSLINSVVNAKALKFDTGAIQFYYGADGGKQASKDDLTGQMTLVFKH